MALCLDIIRSALRKAKALRAGKEPSATDSETGLEALVDLYMGLVSSGKLGAVASVVETGDVTAGENQRIYNLGGVLYVPELPSTVTDEWDGEARQPRDLAVVQSVGEDATTWLYERATGVWTSLNDLELSDYAPLSITMGAGLKAALARALFPEYANPGEVLDPLIQRQAAGFMSGVANRFAEAVDEPTYY